MDQWYQSSLLLVVLMHVPNEVRVQSIGVGEKKYDGIRGLFKMFLEEGLMQKMKEMMDSFE
jgi:hypothetical protein